MTELSDLKAILTKIFMELEVQYVSPVPNPDELEALARQILNIDRSLEPEKADAVKIEEVRNKLKKIADDHYSSLYWPNIAKKQTRLLAAVARSIRNTQKLAEGLQSKDMSAAKSALLGAICNDQTRERPFPYWDNLLSPCLPDGFEDDRLRIMEEFQTEHIRWLEEAAEMIRAKRGRPKKVEMMESIGQLADIWEEYRNVPPSRTYDTYKGEETGEFSELVGNIVIPIHEFLGKGTPSFTDLVRQEIRARKKRYGEK